MEFLSFNLNRFPSIQEQETMMNPVNIGTLEFYVPTLIQTRNDIDGVLL